MPKLSIGDDIIVAPEIDLIFKIKENKCQLFNMDETFVQEFYVPVRKTFEEIVEDKVNELFNRRC